MKELTKESIISEVKALDKNLDEKEDSFKVATILLTALQVGADAKKVSNFLEIPLKEVKVFEKNLRKNKVWVGEKTQCEWFEKDGGVSFWMDVNVALGFMARSND